MKNSPKTKQDVLVLFLLASAAMGRLCAAFPAVVAWVLAPAPAVLAQDLLRLEKSADAMGSTYSVILYGNDRIKMDAAADAALDEVRRLDDLLSNYKPE